jgi:hypothetical protein
MCSLLNVFSIECVEHVLGGKVSVITHSIANTFNSEHIQKRTHSIENTFYQACARRQGEGHSRARASSVLYCPAGVGVCVCACACACVCVCIEYTYV